MPLAGGACSDCNAPPVSSSPDSHVSKVIAGTQALYWTGWCAVDPHSGTSFDKSAHRTQFTFLLSSSVRYIQSPLTAPLALPASPPPSPSAAPTLPFVCQSWGSPHLELSSVSCYQELSLFETLFQTHDYQKLFSHLVSQQLFLTISFLVHILFLSASGCSGAGKPHVYSWHCRNDVTDVKWSEEKGASSSEGREDSAMINFLLLSLILQLGILLRLFPAGEAASCVESKGQWEQRCHTAAYKSRLIYCTLGRLLAWVGDQTQSFDMAGYRGLLGN